MIVLHAHKSTWPAEFQSIRSRLASALGGEARHIAHIGSTAVPGLAAKDIIDVQVTVAGLERGLVPRIETLGLAFVPEHALDHLPPGATEPRQEWTKFYFRSDAPARACHVHVRVLGHANQRYALLFRDFLRTHPGPRQTIERIKTELARLHGDDPDAYYAVKDPVYDLIWHAANDWAARTEWLPAAATEA